ncbi:MAG TPA: hypothetical protein VN861_09060 [Candidatus Acidoferrales bacterium]|nr:hypothetical protein [Candidatus Acidoferrales bacterium]
MAFYDVIILEGSGYASGINQQGEVVGTTLDTGSASPGTADLLSSWWIPPEYSLTTGVAGGLSRVDNMGDAIGLGTELFNIDFKGIVRTLSFNPSDINNAHQVVGNMEIYNWVTPAVISTIPPLSGQTNSEALALNNLGDALGLSGGHGFYCPFGATQSQDLGEDVVLGSINDNKLAAGSAQILGAAYADLTQPGVQLRQIPLPYGAAEGPFLPPAAQAINTGGIIVGFGTGGPGPFSPFYPFVFSIGEGSAADLNTLVASSNAPGWQLVDALDINDAGQIIGQAFGPGNQVAGYVATPRVGGRTVPFTNLIATIIRGLFQELGLSFPGSAAPTGRGLLTPFPLDRNEALLNLAVSNLAGQMSDREARTKIQSIAAEAASRAQSKALQRQSLSSSQKEELAKARKRMLRR